MFRKDSGLSSKLPLEFLQWQPVPSSRVLGRSLWIPVHEGWISSSRKIRRIIIGFPDQKIVLQCETWVKLKSMTSCVEFFFCDRKRGAGTGGWRWGEGNPFLLLGSFGCLVQLVRYSRSSFWVWLIWTINPKDIKSRRLFFVWFLCVPALSNKLEDLIKREIQNCTARSATWLSLNHTNLTHIHTCCM